MTELIHPPLVFIHGLGIDSWMWKYQLPLLSDFTCFTPDLPGHGANNQQRWQSMDESAAQIAALIRKQTPQGRAHVVGLSLGAQVALRLACNTPEVVDHLVCSGLNVIPIAKSSPLFWLIKLTAPLSKIRFLVRATAKQLRIPEVDLETFVQHALLTSEQVIAAAGSENSAYDLPANAKFMTCPTLVVAGEREVTQIQQSLIKLKEGLPNVEIRTAPGVGHSWNCEKPELFAQMVRAWVSGEELPEELKGVRQ
ncbi:MAG: alpha/beta hydrolase [Caldilineaceae bacterium]